MLVCFSTMLKFSDNLPSSSAPPWKTPGPPTRLRPKMRGGCRKRSLLSVCTFAECQIGGDDDGGALVEPADEME